MSYRISFTDTAKCDLRSSADYIADTLKNVDAAKQFVLRIQKEVNLLKEYPASGSFPKDRVLKSAGYRFLTSGDYLIFYIVDEKAAAVYILAIFNAKQDYLRVMKKFL